MHNKKCRNCGKPFPDYKQFKAHTKECNENRITIGDVQTTLAIGEPLKSGATFSPDKKYRYKLWRIWDSTKPKCSFIMLNPSTADEIVLDPTVRRCMDFARLWGYGSLTVGNIFALRSTDPKELYKSEDPIGTGNDEALLDIVKNSDIAITAWGTHGAFTKRGTKVINMLIPDYAEKMAFLERTANGEPMHPLYQPKSVVPIKYQVWRTSEGVLKWL